jgi:prepilin-type N-terminal cleavage/methylation domain-containing protein
VSAVEVRLSRGSGSTGDREGATGGDRVDAASSIHSLKALTVHPSPSTTPRSAGFTMLEMLVVMAIIVLLAAFGFPALQLMFTRSKLQGSAREIAVHLGQSRVTAMRLGRNVIVKPVFDEKRLVSFVDDNENFVQDAGERLVASLPIPGSGGDQSLHMMGPNGVVGTEEDPAEALSGLSTIPSGDPDIPDQHVAVFEPDGSVRDAGGFRISDGKSPANVFEVRIDPAATARVEILKFVYGDNRGLHPEVAPHGSWFGQGGSMWEWY